MHIPRIYRQDRNIKAVIGQMEELFTKNIALPAILSAMTRRQNMTNGRGQYISTDGQVKYHEITLPTPCFPKTPCPSTPRPISAHQSASAIGTSAGRLTLTSPSTPTHKQKRMHDLPQSTLSPKAIVPSGSYDLSRVEGDNGDCEWESESFVQEPQAGNKGRGPSVLVS